MGSEGALELVTWSSPLLENAAHKRRRLDRPSNALLLCAQPVSEVIVHRVVRKVRPSTHANTIFPWGELPPEIQRCILLFLDGKDLCAAASVSTEWYSFSKDEALWKQLCIFTIGRTAKPQHKTWKWLYLASTEEFKTGAVAGRQQTDKGTYEGDWKDGKFDGYGFYTWADNVKYEGEFKAGKLHGKGCMVYTNGDAYDGHWEDDCKSGFGVFMWKSGDKYVGQYKNNQKNGYGEITWGNHPGESYKGFWKDDHKEGFGAYCWPHGGEYSGEWRSNKRHGKGKETWATGAFFDGDWLNDEMHGSGKKICVRDNAYDGTYQGEFKTGRASGWGHREYSDGSSYDGEYVDDKRYGVGVYRWPDGARFEGTWKVGRWQGIYFDSVGVPHPQQWNEVEFDKSYRGL